MTEFTDELAVFKGNFEDQLQSVISRFPEGADHLADATKYCLMAGGKRLRPYLVYAAAQAMSVSDNRWLIPAIAVELVHTYSLVHDDLPAMDDDELRRGKPTCHVAYDEATAILVGDGLQSLAFELLSDGLNQAELSPQQRLAMVSVLSKSAGFKGMVGGQHLDLMGEQSNLNLQQLQHLHLHKTGCLIAASLELGALCNDSVSTEQLMQLNQYGKALGLAFQIVDDVLDVEGDTEVLGKPQGSDQNLHKSTYPSLLGLQGAKDAAQLEVNKALEALRKLDHKAQLLRNVAQYVLTRNH